MGIAAFFVLALLSVLSALGVILSRSPIRSALSLVMTLFLLAVLFVLLDAHMVAALQVVVYAGAIMVLFLFVIMLLNLQSDSRREAPTLRRGAAWATAGLMLALLLAGIWRGPASPGGSVPPEFGTTAALSQRLFTHFVLPFELTSLLLLVAIVGAVVLARRGPA